MAGHNLDPILDKEVIELQQAIGSFCGPPSKAALAWALLCRRICDTYLSIQALLSARHSVILDCRSLLRTMYDAHLQALYLIVDENTAADKAQAFDDFWICEIKRMQDVTEQSATRFAKSVRRSPQASTGRALRNAAYRDLRARAQHNRLPLGEHWYTGTLGELAEQVGLAGEYQLLNRHLSAAVHSSPTALFSCGQDPNSEFQWLPRHLLVRCHFSFATRLGVALSPELREVGEAAMTNWYDLPNWDALE